MSQDGEKSSVIGARQWSIVALGSNLPSASGSPAQTVGVALSHMQDVGLRIEARSRWYATPAWPAESGPDYVNGAAIVSGEDDMSALLALLHGIEGDLGRIQKAGRWDARVCDLDLIACGDRILPDPDTWQVVVDGPPEVRRPGLVLPHPLAHLRAFVMVPVAEIAPQQRHPVLGRTFAALRDALPAADLHAVRPLSG